MTVRRVVNVPASVKARLLNIARETGSTLVLVLRRYAIERLLYRLGQSPFSDRFVLKGAMLFSAWGRELPRPTRDLDLLGLGETGLEALAGVFRALCDAAVGTPDGLLFKASSVRASPILGDPPFNGARVTLEAGLGRARIPLQIDIGFGNAIAPPPIDMEYPSLLGAPLPHIRAYRPETSIAEKTDAMIMRGLSSSRMKDFFDAWFLSNSRFFEGPALLSALAAVLEKRALPVPPDWPVFLTEDFYRHPQKQIQWSAFLGKNGLKGAPVDFSIIGKRIAAFLGPVMRAIADNRHFALSWTPGKGWEQAVSSPSSHPPLSSPTPTPWPGTMPQALRNPW